MDTIFLVYESVYKKSHQKDDVIFFFFHKSTVSFFYFYNYKNLWKIVYLDLIKIKWFNVLSFFFQNRYKSLRDPVLLE